MGVATRPRCTIVFLMILTVGVSLGLPAEDVLDVVYDESEPLPYEALLGFSFALPQILAPIAKAEPDHSAVSGGGPSTKGREVGPENNAGKRNVSESLFIANRSFRS
jgi:hypothetical protein